MKILYVITKANWGGAQQYVYSVALGAKQAGHEVSLAFGNPADGKLVQKIAAEGIETIPIHGLQRDVGIMNDLRALISLVRLLRARKPDIVHVNSSKAGFTGALAARIARMPRIIFTAHGWPFNEDRPWWQRAAFRVLVLATVLLSHVAICVSDAVARDVDFIYVRRRLRVVKNGISAPDFFGRAWSRSQFPDVPENAYWIGMVSELHPTKRVGDAIDAFARLAEAHPTALLVILGEGEEHRKLDARIKKLDLADRIYLLGFVEDAARLLKAFDLFVHASRSEALALAVLEAGVAGLPIVATRVGGIPEIIPDDSYGLLVPRENPVALAEGMKTLIEDPERARGMGARLQERINEAFTEERMVRETLEVYQPPAPAAT